MSSHYYYYSTSDFSRTYNYVNYTDNTHVLDNEEDFFNWIIEFKCSKEEIEKIHTCNRCLKCNGTCITKDILEDIITILKKSNKNFIVHKRNIPQNIKHYNNIKDYVSNDDFLIKCGITQEYFLQKLKTVLNID